MKDTNYKNQLRILSNVLNLCVEWLADHGDLENPNSKDEKLSKEFLGSKIDHIKKIQISALLEKTQVEQQSYIADHPEISKEKNFNTGTFLGFKNLDVAMNIGAHSYAIGDAINKNHT